MDHKYDRVATKWLRLNPNLTAVEYTKTVFNLMPKQAAWRAVHKEFHQVIYHTFLLQNSSGVVWSGGEMQFVNAENLSELHEVLHTIATSGLEGLLRNVVQEQNELFGEVGAELIGNATEHQEKVIAAANWAQAQIQLTSDILFF